MGFTVMPARLPAAVTMQSEVTEAYSVRASVSEGMDRHIEPLTKILSIFSDGTTH